MKALLLLATLCPLLQFSQQPEKNPSEAEIVRLTNLERKQQGKTGLKVNLLLTNIAQQHANNMAKQNKLSHQLDGKSAGDRLKKGKYAFGAYAENIAMGHPTSAAVVQGWMKSKGHKDNILDSNNFGLTEIGVGIARDAKGRIWYCQVFGKPVPVQQKEVQE